LNSDAAGLENLCITPKKIPGKSPGVIRDEVDMLSFEECPLFVEVIHMET